MRPQVSICVCVHVPACGQIEQMRVWASERGHEWAPRRVNLLIRVCECVHASLRVSIWQGEWLLHGRVRLTCASQTVPWQQ